MECVYSLFCGICWLTGFFCEYETRLHSILFTVHVVFVGRLVCSVNVLYMELSYTGGPVD